MSEVSLHPARHPGNLTRGRGSTAACIALVPLLQVRCMATWKKEFKLAWREASPPNHLDGKLDSGQGVIQNSLSLDRVMAVIVGRVSC